MKTKHWIIGLSLLLIICLALSFFLLWPGHGAASVRVLSQGKCLYTLPLDKDTQITVQTQLGTNVVAVKNGRVAVTQADCPDQHCVKRGYCDGGSPIVCLPHRLVLEFTGRQAVDAIVG